MSYYVVYNRNLNNSLVGVSENMPTTDNQDFIIKSVAGGIPDLSKHTWNTATIRFDPLAGATMSKLDFMNRFTDEELMSIYSAAKVYPSVEIWLEKFKAAQDVDVSNFHTIEGINALEQGGLIGVGRASEILA